MIFVDAEAICEAASRPAMRFVTPKTESQQTLSVLHRVRESLVRERTRTINQMHGFLLEFGISLPVGKAAVTRLPAVLAEQSLPPAWLRSSSACTSTSSTLSEQIGEIDKEIARQLADDELGQRLMSIPGVGPVTASVLAAKMGDGKAVRMQSRFCGVGWARSPAIQYGRQDQSSRDQPARRQKCQAPARPVRPSLHARLGETNRSSGRLGSRDARATTFKRGGVCAGQQAGPNGVVIVAAPHHIRRRLRNSPDLNEHSFIFT